MERVVYFTDKMVVFSAQPPTCQGGVVVGREQLSRAKILKILETCNYITVLDALPEEAFQIFAADFLTVQAAGGIVSDGCGNHLMIHRNGRWDLPKGHWEPGESIEACALREVIEETGVSGVWIVRELCQTLHAYPLRGLWELKCTHWYAMQSPGAVPLTPQREEGIDQAAWCSELKLQEHLQESYPTIRRVVACLRG